MRVLLGVLALSLVSSAVLAAKKPVDVYVETLVEKPFYEELTYITNLRPFREVKVFSYVDGNIAKKFKDNGEYVRKGEPIAAVKNITPGYSFSNHIIKAPISGILNGFYEEVGSYVSKGPPVLSIMDVSKWRIALPMPQQDLAYLKQEKVRILVQPQGSTQKVIGQLLRVAPTVDPVLGTSVAEFVFAKDALKDARVGMISQVRVQYNVENAIGVLQKHLMDSRSKKKKYVYVVNEKNEANQRFLETGVIREGLVKITSGLKAGERIITQMPNWYLKNGQKVNPMPDSKKDELR